MRKFAGRQKATEVMAPVGSTAVSKGALRILSPEGLIVQGSSSVTGTQNVSGALNTTGTQTVSGSLGVTGTQTVAGTLAVSGAQTVTGSLGVSGTLAVSGAATLGSTLTVNSPGQIVVAGGNSLTMGIGAFGQPGVGFASGGGVTGYAGGALLHGGAALVGCSVTSSIAQLSSGGNFLSVGPSKSSFTGPLEATSSTVSFTNLPLKAGAAVNVHIDSAGKLWRTS